MPSLAICIDAYVANCFFTSRKIKRDFKICKLVNQGPRILVTYESFDIAKSHPKFNDERRETYLVSTITIDQVRILKKIFSEKIDNEAKISKPLPI